jgi:hypothetical protein
VFDDGDGGFPGFSVGAGKTLSVRVRLAVAEDAVPNDVVANAAVVQRRGDDGDWVGQSNGYRFRIVDDEGVPQVPQDPSELPEDSSPLPQDPSQPPQEPSQLPQDPSQPPQEPSQLPQDPSQPPPDPPDKAVPEKGLPFPDELAGTGPASRRGLLGAAAGALLLIATGAGAMLMARRRR